MTKLKVAEFVKTVLFVAAVLDVAQRLGSVQMELTFRLYVEIVGAVLLIGSAYIVRRDRRMERERRELAWRTAVRQNIERVRVGAQVAVALAGIHEKCTAEWQENNTIKTEWPEEDTTTGGVHGS